MTFEVNPATGLTNILMFVLDRITVVALSTKHVHVVTGRQVLYHSQ